MERKFIGTSVIFAPRDFASSTKVPQVQCPFNVSFLAMSFLIARNPVPQSSTFTLSLAI